MSNVAMSGGGGVARTTVPHQTLIPANTARGDNAWLDLLGVSHPVPGG